MDLQFVVASEFEEVTPKKHERHGTPRVSGFPFSVFRLFRGLNS
jgi:hypothetical protein